jgi:hypothetical protein
VPFISLFRCVINLAAAYLQCDILKAVCVQMTILVVTSFPEEYAATIFTVKCLGWEQ